MEARPGPIERGAVARSEPTDAPDGTDAFVLIATAESIRASYEEQGLIDAGLRESESPGGIEARAFLRGLRPAR